MEVSQAFGTVIAVIIGCYILESLLYGLKDSREPVYIRPRLPLFGHMYGIIRNGLNSYFFAIQ
jgi:hypothetical protein